MWELKACTVCFSTGVKLYSLNRGTLRKDFNLISGLKMETGNGMPEYLCVECTAYVNKFKKFRDKCHRAHYALQQILCRSKEIKKSHLKDFSYDQLNLIPKLSFMSLDRTRTLQTEFKLVNFYRQGVSSIPGLIPVAHCSTESNEDTLELDMKVVDECANIKTEEDQTEDNDDTAATYIEIDQFVPNQNGIVTEQTEMDTTDIEELNSKSLLQSVPVDIDDNDVDNDTIEYEYDVDDDDDDNFELMSCQLNNKVDGVSAKEDYGDVVPISFMEAKAAYEVHKYCSTGQYRCECGKAFEMKMNYEQHLRRHNVHTSGRYRCEICDVYFRTAFKRETHMSINHMYKYLCKKCPHVLFTKTSAKQHLVSHHSTSDRKTRTTKRPKPTIVIVNTKTTRPKVEAPKPKKKKLPKDFLTYSPQSQKEQYLLIQKRKESRNYLEAKFRCELCFRGYRLTSTYNKHMAKHDSSKSGSHQCDMCKHYFRNTRGLYKHMCMYHLCKYSCQYCEFVTTNKGQAINHYKWHKNVTYDCPHCDKKFNKISTQLTHIRFKHPGTDLCNLCGHSFVSAIGLNCHKIVSHSKEEIDASEALIVNPESTSPLYCGECRLQFASQQAYTTHLGSSKNHCDTNISSRTMVSSKRRISRLEGGGSVKARRHRTAAGDSTLTGSSILNTGTSTSTNCEVCGVFLASDVLARRHYETEHPGTDYLKRYMCDVCGHTTRQYANLLVHMRTHTREKPYECPHCDRRFSMTSNRDRHLVVHTGEKRYQCQHCSRRFTQSTAVKLHIQTVHMKIPYKPWDKKNRKRRKEQPTTAGADVTEQTAMNMSVVPVPQHKLLMEPQTEYITYISFAEEQ